jgi:predicted transposase/invertase (TIGR01784 family)
MPEHRLIEDLEYADSFQNYRSEDERGAIFDLHCKGKNGEAFIIEMQRAPQAFFMSRLLYYATFPIREMSEKGDWDYSLKPIYSIAVMNFKLPNKKHSDKILHHHQIKDDENEVSEDSLNFITLQLPKFKKEDPETLENDFERWLYVLRYLENLDDRPQALQARVWEKIFEQAQIAKLTGDDLKRYQQSLKVHRDNKSVLDYAEERGEKRAWQRAEKEIKRAAKEKKRAEEEKQRAEEEKQRAEEEKQRAEEEKLKAELKNQALLLHYRDGLSAEEIAGRLEISIEAVRSLLSE